MENKTSLQILRAFAETVRDGVFASAAGQMAQQSARIALEAAARAPGLADDPMALKLFAVDTRLVEQDDICRAILRNIDDYQRKGIINANCTRVFD